MTTAVQACKCGETKFHRCEDGLQCWSCGRILYDQVPLDIPRKRGPTNIDRPKKGVR